MLSTVAIGVAARSGLARSMREDHREIGWTVAHQTLVVNVYAARGTLETDALLRSGCDMIIVAPLGAERVCFATVPTVTMGRSMVQLCHLDTSLGCIATRDLALLANIESRTEEPRFQRELSTWNMKALQCSRSAPFVLSEFSWDWNATRSASSIVVG